MKNILFLFVVITVVLQSCNKDRTYLKGKAVIEGTMVYRDSLNEKHPASNVKIKLFAEDGSTLLFETTSDNGIFRFESLDKGEYRIVSSFTANGIEYNNNTALTLSNDHEYLSNVEIVLVSTTEEEVLGSLSGHASFSNLITGTESSAVNAVLHLLDDSGEEVTSVTTQSDGSYEITDITLGSYILKAELTTFPDANGTPVVYTQTLPINIMADVSQNLLLEWNNSGTLLRIHVTDSIQNPIVGVQTCIYNNQNFLLSNIYTCNGSQRIANTETHGNVLFSGLSSIQYYISSTISIGAVDLFSDSLAATSTQIVSGTLNTTTIELRQHW